MKIIIDTKAKIISEETEGRVRHFSLYSDEAFELLSRQWIRVGWNQKYPYTFSWMGRPIIQIPEDIIRAQEVIFRIKPDIIVETGIAHGGSLIFYASLCKIMGKGKIIGVDIEIRPHNRNAIEQHELYPFISLVEGDSTDPKIVSQVGGLIQRNEKVMIFLDSNHTKQHVFKELMLYGGFVTPGSYIVVADGIMKDLGDVPRGNPSWRTDNPIEAIMEFTKQHKDFVIEEPERIFNESSLTTNVTHWPCAWLRKR